MGFASTLGMASISRCYILEDNSNFHVTWQCHNQDWLLREDWTKTIYYNLLLKYKARYGVTIHSYCFMDNHFHASGRLENLEDFSAFWRVVHSCFAKTFNQRQKRRGQVVMDRFKSPRIQTDTDLFKVMLYIDLNPRRAGKVGHPNQNRFSSYRFYAYGEEDPLLTAPETYLALGHSPEKRQKAYREMIELILKNDWKQKKPYSSIKFIGDPDWVVAKTQTLARKLRERHRGWKQRHRARFG